MTELRYWATRLILAATDARARVILLLGVLAVAAAAGVLIDLPDPEKLRQDVAAAGSAAPVLAVPIMALLTTLLVPRSALTVLTGVIFPPVTAIVCAVTGSALGAAIAFGVGRHLGEPYLSTLRQDERFHQRLQVLNRIERRGLTAVVLVRFLPVLPFGLLNYTFGATTIRPLVFLAGTTVGILPTTAAQVLFGATLWQLRDQPTALAGLAAAALVVAVVVIVFGRRGRRRRTPQP